MAAAYSKDIDLDKVVGGLDKAAHNVDKLASGANAAASEINSKLGGAFSKLDDYISKTLKNSNSAFGNLIDKVDGLGKSMGKVSAGGLAEKLGLVGKVGESAFGALATGAKIFGITLRWALGPLRMIFFVLEVIKKINPFGWLKQALSWATDLFNKLKDVASGSNNEHREARKARTDAQSMKNINKAGAQGIGWTSQDISDFQALLDSNEGQSFASMLGLDAQQLKQMDGVEAFLKAQRAAREALKSWGGRDDISMDTFNKTIGQLSAFSSSELAATNDMFGRDVKYFYELQNKDKRDNKALREFERESNKLGDSWDIMIATAMSQLAPIVTAVTKGLRSLLDSITEWLRTNPFANFLQAIKDFVISMKVWINEKFGLMGDDDDVATYKQNQANARKNLLAQLASKMENLHVSQTINDDSDAMGRAKNRKKNAAIGSNTGLLNTDVNNLNMMLSANKTQLLQPNEFEKQLKKSMQFFNESLSNDDVKSLIATISDAKKSSGKDILIGVETKGDNLVLSIKDRGDKSLIKQTVIAKGLLGV